MSTTPDPVPRLEELQRDFELGNDVLAAILAVSPRTVARWHQGMMPGKRALQRLDALLALRLQLWELLSSRDQRLSWLNTPRAYLGWLTPAEVLRTGRIDCVRADLDGLAADIYQ